MPSLFHRPRRSSEGIPPAPIDPSHLSNKRASMETDPNTPSPSPGGKVKSFLKSGGDGKGDTLDSLKKRLTSPSTIFKQTAEAERRLSIQHAIPEDSVSQPASALRKGLTTGQTKTSATPGFNTDIFSNSATGNQAVQPIQSSWLSAYAAVEEAWENGDVAPESHGPGNTAMSNGSSANENVQRSSIDRLDSFPVMKPSTPKPQGALLPTAPLSADTPGRDIANGARPTLSLQISSTTSQPPNPTPMSPSTDSPSAFTGSSIPAPNPEHQSRPEMPFRKPTLIQSPPMPRPIKNLPTLQGWSGFNNTPGGPATPSWGALAKEGGPKTPGAMGWMSPATPRTPGIGSFPFSTQGVPVNLDKGKQRMTEEEVRKARRAMPVMLREPSFIPHEHDQGGEAGDDDGDTEDESEPEMEGNEEDDSEPETETERATAARKTLVSAIGLKGKGKGRARAASTSTTMGTLQEEGDGPSGQGFIAAKPPATSSRRPGELKIETKPTTAPVSARSLWSLPTPTRQSGFVSEGSWTHFSSETPGQTPRTPFAGARGSSVWGALSRTETTTASTRSTADSDGYFGSQPSTSSTHTPGSALPVNGPTIATGAEQETAVTDLAGLGLGPIVGTGSGPPEVVELTSTENANVGFVPQPAENTDTGGVPGPAENSDVDGVPKRAGNADVGVSEHTENAVVSVSEEPEPARPASTEDADGEDNDSDDSVDAGSSAHGHTSGSSLAHSSAVVHVPLSGATPPAPAHPSTPAHSSGTATPRPTPSSRPSLYTQHSQSMIDLRPTPPSESTPDARRGPGTGIGMGMSKLESIPSREAVPSRIDLPPRDLNDIKIGLPTPHEWAPKPPPTPAAGFGQFFWAKGRKDLEKPTLKRRKSADDVSTPPPDYAPPHPGVVIPRPRDEEGKEKLPAYWCAVHIEGNLQRKMEFSAPGVQSRDRSWKKAYFILHGTSLQVYKFDPHRFPVKEPIPPQLPIVTELESEEYLHVHVPGERRPSATMSPAVAAHAAAAARRPSDAGVHGGRRSSASSSPLVNEARRGSASSTTLSVGTAGSSAATTSSSTTTAGSMASSSGTTVGSSMGSVTGAVSGPGLGEKDPAIFAAQLQHPRRASVSTISSTSGAGSGGTSIASHFQQNHLIKQYTMQNAESGLAADYVKRTNVVRVRTEGEQFLLQTENARDVVDWIEAFQAATNVALDLDDRPMPKIITLPRRRRRRPGAAGAAAGAAAGTGAGAGGVVIAGVPGTDDTPEGNARAVEAAERAARERDRMLAEDQARESVQ